MSPESIFKLVELIQEQTNDLWTISTGLIAIEVAIIAHLLTWPPGGPHSVSPARARLRTHGAASGQGRRM